MGGDSNRKANKARVHCAHYNILPKRKHYTFFNRGNAVIDTSWLLSQRPRNRQAYVYNMKHCDFETEHNNIIMCV